MRDAAKKAKNDKLEKELWGQLNELNTEFATINKIKKKNKKNLKTKTRYKWNCKYKTVFF